MKYENNKIDTTFIKVWVLIITDFEHNLMYQLGMSNKFRTKYILLREMIQWNTYVIE